MTRQRILLTGASGILGSAIRAAAASTRYGAPVELVPAVRVRRGPEDADAVTLDLLDRTSLEAALARVAPDVVLHPAAVADPAEAARDPEQALRVNRDGTAHLADLCRARGARLVAVSTDLVFAGRPGGGYREDDAPAPLAPYAATKLAAERAALGRSPDVLVVRTSLLLAPRACDRGHVARLARELADGGPGAALFTDEIRSPILVADLAQALLTLATLDVRGLLHVAGQAPLSRHELGALLARMLGLDASRIRPALRADVPGPPRPGDVTLSSERAQALGIVTRPIEEGATELRGA